MVALIGSFQMRYVHLVVLLIMENKVITQIIKERLMIMGSQEMARLLNSLNVKTVIRLNNDCYDKQNLTRIGINHYDFLYPDGSIPDESTFLRCIEVILNEKKPLGIHCRAGIGRTGTMIGSYLILNYQMPAKIAMAWMRLQRPGMVSTYQQEFLLGVERDNLGTNPTPHIDKNHKIVTQQQERNFKSVFNSPEPLQHEIVNRPIISMIQPIVQQQAPRINTIQRPIEQQKNLISEELIPTQQMSNLKPQESRPQMIQSINRLNKISLRSHSPRGQRLLSYSPVPGSVRKPVHLIQSKNTGVGNIGTNMFSRDLMMKRSQTPVPTRIEGIGNSPRPMNPMRESFDPNRVPVTRSTMFCTLAPSYAPALSSSQQPQSLTPSKGVREVLSYSSRRESRSPGPGKLLEVMQTPVFQPSLNIIDTYSIPHMQRDYNTISLMKRSDRLSKTPLITNYSSYNN